jgi:Rps23 Pro-64 3,4-dihydroxylase Tpa1-like proline 4-hydroxylase
MTSKQVLDAFSETLMQDERILSSRERELLTNLLQSAREASSNAETQAAVAAVIARSVGETVAQRAFTLLGSNIVEQIVGRGAASAGADERHGSPTVIAGTPTPPQPPGPVRPPQPPSGPQPPSRSQATPLRPATQPSQPVSSGGVSVLEAPAIVRAQSVVLDEFLSPEEVQELIRFTLAHEADFRTSEVISPSGEPETTDYSHRRSRVLMELGPHEDVILNRIRGVLPSVLEQLGMDEFPVTRTEVQITASNDGDFFHAHCDDSQDMIASRRMTFVYFFHREPNQFEGGELRLHDSRRTGHHPVSAGTYETIIPRQNQIVFFPCSTLHEISEVRCQSRAFADSRFTVNGWLHQ